MQVIAWRTVSEMTCNVSSGTLNLTHALTHSLVLISPSSGESACSLIAAKVFVRDSDIIQHCCVKRNSVEGKAGIGVAGHTERHRL